MRYPIVTISLFALIGVGYIAQQLLGDIIIVRFALWPYDRTEYATHHGQLLEIGFHFWQLISYAFLHGGMVHLLFNSVALYMFGPPIERVFGHLAFLQYYMLTVVGAALAQLAVLHWLEPGIMVPTLGASGGVFGLLLAFGMLYPHARIMPIFPPIPMPAWLFVILYGLLELVLGISQTSANVAHFAHLGGMVAGFILLQYKRGKLWVKPKHILRRW